MSASPSTQRRQTPAGIAPLRLSAADWTLGAVVGLMMWMWVSTIVVLVGAQIDAQIAARVRKTT